MKIEGIFHPSYEIQNQTDIAGLQQLLANHEQCLLPDDLIRNLSLTERQWNISQQADGFLAFGLHNNSDDLNKALTVLRTEHKQDLTHRFQHGAITVSGIGYDTTGQQRIISARYNRTTLYSLDALRVSLPEEQRAHLTHEYGSYQPPFNDLDITQGMIDFTSQNGSPHTRLIQAYRNREGAPISIFGEPISPYTNAQYVFYKTQTAAYLTSPYGWKVYVPATLESVNM